MKIVLSGSTVTFSILVHLVRIGVLQKQEVGREKFFIHTKLMELLTRDKNGFDPYLSQDIGNPS
jgi:hypothetical protein